MDNCSYAVNNDDIIINTSRISSEINAIQIRNRDKVVEVYKHALAFAYLSDWKHSVYDKT